MSRLFILVAVLLTGCAVNPYSQFYRGVPDPKQLPSFVPPTGPLQIYSSNDFERDRLALMQRGLIPIGKSAFNGNAARVTDSELREQAARLGAQAVLVSSMHTGTISGAMPLVLPTVNTSYTTGSATAYGAGGTVNVYGNATTTTYGTQTTMIPYTVERSDFQAIYFVKEQTRLGIFPVKLDDATRRQRESNLGVFVQVVVDGSPAFLADILPGDLVLQIGDDPVQSPENFLSLLAKYAGESVSIRIERNGKSVTKQVQLHTYEPVASAKQQKK